MYGRRKVVRRRYLGRYEAAAGEHTMPSVGSLGMMMMMIMTSLVTVVAVAVVAAVAVVWILLKLCGRCFRCCLDFYVCRENKDGGGGGACL